MRSTFTYLKKSCPVCNGARKDCRQSKLTSHIHCRTASPTSGWHLVGEDAHGFGIYSDTEAENNVDREAYQRKLQEHKKAEQEQLKTALPIEQRDKEYRSIARRRGLATRHRQELQRRGLSNNQIDWMHQQGIVWSWSGGKLSDISANLPGAAGQNRLRNFKGLSLAIAAPSIDGLVAGCQLRPNEGGYFWVSSASKGGYAPKLPNGENPIGVYRPMGEPLGQQLWLAEGFLKPQIAALRLNEVVIGAAGGQFASSPEQVKAAIATFPNLPITLAVDGGAVANRDVMRAYQGLHQLITEQGRELQVAWWGQTTKDRGDIDEISDFESIQFISWEQFTAIALEHGGLKPDSKTDYQPTEIYSPEYINQMSAAAADWEAQQQQIESGQFEEKKTKFIGELEAKRGKLRKEVKPNAAAAAARAMAAVQTDVYHVANQQEAIQTALKLGKRVLVNVTMTGGGKNYEDANLLADALSLLGINKKISVLPDALNPSQDAYNEHYSRLDGRHLGTYLDPLSGKLRRITEDKVPGVQTELSNCDYAAVPNIHPILKCNACPHSWACGQAPQFNEIRSGFGARHQAHEAWRNPNIITSYGRLPVPGSEEFDILNQSWLTLDEARERVEIAKTTSVTRQDILEKQRQIEKEAPELAPFFRDLFDYLLEQKYKDNEAFHQRYGVPLANIFFEIQDAIAIGDEEEVEDEDGTSRIGSAIAQLEIDWDTLQDLENEVENQRRVIFGDPANKLTDKQRGRLQRLQKKSKPNATEAQQVRALEAKAEQAGGKLNRDDRRLLQQLRSQFLSEAEEYELAQLQEQNERTKFKPLSPSELRNKSASVVKSWLVDFLSVAVANQPGNIHFNADKSIDVTVLTDHHRSAIAAARYVMLMGAYEARTNEEIAQRYGCHPNEVFIFDTRPSWQAKPSNLKFVQITSLGKMGRQRGPSFEDARLTTDAELERRNPGKHLNYDLKGQTRDKTHFVENSSDNQPFEQGVTSILMTVPRPNMAAKLAEYCALTGYLVGIDHEGFQLFYQLELQNLILQTAGRFRAHWRPDEQLTLYIISEDELPVEVDEIVSAAEITPEAAVKTEKAWYLIDKVIADIAIAGEKLTQAAIVAGVKALNPLQRLKQSWLSQLFSDIPGGWKLFKSIFNGIFKDADQPQLENISRAIDQHSETNKFKISQSELAELTQFFTSIVELYQQATITAPEVVKEVISIALSLGSKVWRAVTASMPPELRSQLQAIVMECYPSAPKWLGVPK